MCIRDSVASGDKSETNGQYPEGLMKIQKRQGYCLLLNVDGADYSRFMNVTAKMALHLIPEQLKSQPVFLCIDEMCIRDRYWVMEYWSPGKNAPIQNKMHLIKKLITELRFFLQNSSVLP